MSIRELAEKLEANGWHLSEASLTRIELMTIHGSSAPGRRVTVDDLVALASVFSIEPGALLTAGSCDVCFGVPPAGFSCNTCGSGEMRDD